MVDADELDVLERAVIEALRARSAHVRKLLHPPPAPDWQAAYERLDAAYREAREALDEWIADRRAQPGA